MNPNNLAEIRECVAHGDRAAALAALRAAIEENKIKSRDGIELMLAVRQGSMAAAADAIEKMGRGLSGVYRCAPKAGYVLA
jgi:hypothetical protein